MFPMNWRFLATLDHSVDLYGCRDLDSRLSEREVAAVREFEVSDAAVHCMRDNPFHGVPFLGAAWGARLDLNGSRPLWEGAWGAMLEDPLCWAGREQKGPDQDLLTK